MSETIFCGPESISIDTIESLPEVNEVYKQGCVPLFTLFNYVSQSKNLIWETSSWSKPCLFLSDSLVHAALKSFVKSSNYLMSVRYLSDHLCVQEDLLEVGGNATVFRGQGCLKTFLKCSTNLATCSRSVVSMPCS